MWRTGTGHDVVVVGGPLKEGVIVFWVWGSGVFAAISMIAFAAISTGNHSSGVLGRSGKARRRGAVDSMSG